MSKFEIIEKPWDSNFFGFPIYQVSINHEHEFKEIEAHLKQRKAFYYIFSDLALHNCTPIDVKVTFKKQVTINFQTPQLEYYKTTATSFHEIKELAFQSGAFSRFKIDVDLNPKFEKLYEMWIEKSIEGSFADEVLVTYNADKISGFITLKYNDLFAAIGLIAVDESLRGKGTGRRLMQMAEFATNQKSLSEIRVPTQLANLRACNFYKIQGYTELNRTYIYHLNNL